MSRGTARVRGSRERDRSVDWNPAHISAFVDEISGDLDAQMEALVAHGVGNIELRAV